MLRLIEVIWLAQVYRINGRAGVERQDLDFQLDLLTVRIEKDMCFVLEYYQQLRESHHTEKEMPRLNLYVCVKCVCASMCVNLFTCGLELFNWS